MTLTRRGRLVGAVLLLAVLGFAGWGSGRLMRATPSPQVHSRAAMLGPTATARPTPVGQAAPVTVFAPTTAAQQRQVDYALKYWKNYNTAEFGNDNPSGGDCANFVSQTLLQRGWKMNSVWFNHGPGAMSSVWAYVPSMYNYFVADGAQLGLTRLGENDRAKYAVGDIVMFWWKNSSGAYSAEPEHVQVIDRIATTAGKVSVQMASHNTDYQYRDLDDEITHEHPGAKFVVWHLTRNTN